MKLHQPTFGIIEGEDRPEGLADLVDLDGFICVHPAMVAIQEAARRRERLERALARAFEIAFR